MSPEHAWHHNDGGAGASAAPKRDVMLHVYISSVTCHTHGYPIYYLSIFVKDGEGGIDLGGEAQRRLRE